MIGQILSEWPAWGLSNEAPLPEQLRPLPGGLTNRCYLLHLGDADYVLRIEGHNSEALDINRQSEWLVHQLVAGKGLTPEVRYRSPSGHYWLRDYVPGQSLNAADLTLPRLMVMVQQLHQLHGLPLPDGIPALRISDKASHYWNIISTFAGDELLALRAPLQSLLGGFPDERRCLCHMDPLPANWILTPADQLVLLDWEYASVGHPLWDIAALLQSANLTGGEEKQLLTACGIADNREWQLARAQVSYLSALWYGAQQMWREKELLQYLNQLPRAIGGASPVSV